MNERTNRQFWTDGLEGPITPQYFPFFEPGHVPELADSHPQVGAPSYPTLAGRVEPRRAAPALRKVDPGEREAIADKVYQALGLRHGTPAGDLGSWVSHGIITKLLTDVIERVADHYGLTRKETVALNVALFFLYREVIEPDGLNFDSVMDVLLPAAVAAAEILWEER